MKKVAIYIVAFIFFMATILGCAPSPPSASAQSSLTVTYNNKIIHKRNQGWITFHDLKAYMLKPQKKFIIFGARWCGPCKFVRRLVNQMNFKYDIAWVDIDTPWGQLLYQRLGHKTVPIMIEADEQDRQIGVYDDAQKIVMRLMLIK